MAWTSCGGTTLEVEAARMPGRGDLKLTGSLGDVMKESALAAFSYVRGHARELGINQKVFKENDFHIHVPDGATPKDGPSAGITLATAIVSLLTNKPVRPRLSMTGEITLSGKVTPIGGVREKVIAALRAGIRDVVMPADNEKDLEDVPQEVRSKITFHFVRSIDEVLKIAMPKNVKPYVPKRGEKTKDEFYVYDDYLFQQVEPEAEPDERKAVPASDGKTDGAKPDGNVPDAGKPEEDKSAAAPAEPAKPASAEPASPAEKKPQEPAKPAPAEQKNAPDAGTKQEEKPVPPDGETQHEPVPAEEKKPEHHPASQFEFRKPTLVVNYPKFQNTSFTVGQVTLKAPGPHPLPEQQKTVPPRSFKPSDNLHLDVRIATSKEFEEGPVVSLVFPAKTETPPVPAHKKPARKAVPKSFRAAKPMKLRVKVSPAIPEGAPAADAPKKKTPHRSGGASSKKGK